MSDQLLKKLRSHKWTSDYKEGVRELGALSELAQARGSALKDAAEELREYLQSSMCNGFDIPDRIWTPFVNALDAETGKAPNDKLTDGSAKNQ